MINRLGIGVGVHHGDNRNVHALRLGDRNGLLPGVNDEDDARQLLHLLDAAEVLLQPCSLLVEPGDFLLGEALEGAVDFHLFQLLEPEEGPLDGGEVGEHATEPAVVHIEHTTSLGFSLDCLLRLLFCSDKEHRLVLQDRLTYRVIGVLDASDGLLQVDDVDPVAFREDESLHPGIPALGLVPEVHS